MSRWSAAVTLVAIAGLVVLALAFNRPPEPLGADAPPDVFSAERALGHVEAIAGEPRPPGTEAHARAEEYLLGELRSLGLEVEVQEGWVVSRWGSGAVAMRARNLVACREGTGGGDAAVVLLSHYDSVPTGPGAGDDGAGVAATLEALRALGDRELVNDILVVMTDGEEGGLNGARLFVDEHPRASDVGVVLNLEARGNRGVVQMFQTSPGSAPLVRALAEASPHPFASSLSGEVYRRMPNDTDLTVFLEAGHAGMNFAMIGNHSAYHTELDTPDRLSLASLQHLGTQALSLATHFGAADLADLRGEELVYFNPLGGRWLLVYSVPLARLMAMAALVLLGVGLYRGLATNRLDAASVRAGAWAWLLLLVTGAAISMVSWRFLEELVPTALAAPHGDPYGRERLLLALVVACLGACGLMGWIFGSSRQRGLAAGVAIPWALGAVGLSIWFPGASYLLAWPALVAAGVVVLAPMMRDPRWLAPLLGAAAAVAALVFAPAIVLAVEALQLSAALVVGLVLALPMTLLVPLAPALVGERLWIPVTIVVAGLGAFFWSAIEASPSALTPAPTSLTYAYDADEQKAYWMSYETAVDEWTSQVLPASSQPVAPPSFLQVSAEARRLIAAAPAIELEPPRAELVDDVYEESVRLLSVRVSSPRGAPFLMVAPDPSLATLRAIGLPGRMVEVDANADPVILLIENLPAEGVVVAVETFDRQPVELSLLDWSFGLPQLAEAPLEPRPSHLIRSTRWTSDSLLVHASQWF